MSRHMYDIGQMLKTSIADSAIHNEKLYHQIIEYRRKFIGLRDFDYNSLYPNAINIIPPDSIIRQWETDYENMRLHMIYGESVSFVELIDNLRHFNEYIKGISM